MFKALKDKLKNAIKKFSKDVEEASEVVETKEETKTKEVIKPKEEVKVESEEEFTFDKDESIELSNEVEELEVEEKPETVEKKSGFFGKIKSMFSKEDKIETDETRETDETTKADDVGEFEPLVDETDVPDEPEDKGQEFNEEEIKKQVQKEIRTAEQPEEAKLKPEEEEDLDEYINDLNDKSTNGVDIDEVKYIDAIKDVKKDEGVEESFFEITDQDLEKEEDKDFPEEEKTEAEEITEKAEDIEIEEPVEDLPDYKKGKDKVEDEELIIEEPEDEPTEEVEEKEEQVVDEDIIFEESEEPSIKKKKKEIAKELELTDEQEEKEESEKSEIIKEKEEQEIEETIEEPEEEQEEKKGFFSKITDIVTKTKLSDKKFDELFWEMELILLENNVAVEVIDKIKQDLREKLVGQAIRRGQLEVEIFKTLSKSIESLFDVDKIDLIKMVKEKNKSGEPFVIAFIGVNGSGKTTTIAKVARLFQNYKLKPVIAAADTFRAAAIQQIEEHANNLGVKLIKHDYGSDPAAVAFDAIKHAKQKGFNVVLVDTAGRLHSNTNLMDEMKKIIRVAKPDLKIFIGEAITGNDCVEQAKEFNDAVGIDGVILCKADVDDKGGAAISTSYVTGKPIMYLGTGQGYDDLKEFNKKMVMDSLELD